MKMRQVGALIATLFSATIGGGSQVARAQELGLKFATPAQLQGVPLALTPFSGASLPPVVDLSADLPPVGQQGHQSSCVAWAIAYALKSFQERREQHWNLGTLAAPDAQHLFSPAFLYNQINHGVDGGAFVMDALRIVRSQGVASLADMPYNDTDFLTAPNAAQLAAAAPYRIAEWRQVNVQDPLELKAQLNAGFPVVIAAMVDDGFRQADATFVWNHSTGAQLGGHALILVGYNDQKNAFRVMNSWGPGWGDSGFSWIDYNYLPQVVREGYIAVDAPNGPPPAPAPGPVGPAPPPPSPPPPAPGTNVQFALQNIFHNLPSAFGPTMRLTGSIQIPPGSSGQFMVVVQFYLDAGGGTKGFPVGSINPQFATPQGFAATGFTQPIPPGGLQTNWFADLPYGTLNVPRGGPFNPIQTNLVAEPILYINNFGVRSGGVLPFFVRL